MRDSELHFRASAIAAVAIALTLAVVAQSAPEPTQEQLDAFLIRCQAVHADNLDFEDPHKPLYTEIEPKVGGIGCVRPDAFLRVVELIDDGTALARIEIERLDVERIRQDMAKRVAEIREHRTPSMPPMEDHIRITYREVILRSDIPHFFGKQLLELDKINAEHLPRVSVLSALFWHPETVQYTPSEGELREVLVLETLELSEEQQRKFSKWASARTWTSSDGEHTREAIITDASRTRVELMNEHGEKKWFRLQDLAREDRVYIRGWSKSMEASRNWQDRLRFGRP